MIDHHWSTKVNAYEFQELQKWLDESKDGFIYVSFGSMMKIESFPKEILAEIYTAFAEISPIRVLIKVASPQDLPPGIPKNVMTLTWAPQISILSEYNAQNKNQQFLEPLITRNFRTQKHPSVFGARWLNGSSGSCDTWRPNHWRAAIRRSVTQR